MGTTFALQAMDIWRNPDVMDTKATWRQNPSTGPFSACLFPLGSTPDQETNFEPSFAQYHPMFPHQGLKPVPIVSFFALSHQNQPTGSLLQPHKVPRLSGTNFSRKRSS